MGQTSESLENDTKEDIDEFEKTGVTKSQVNFNEVNKVLQEKIKLEDKSTKSFLGHTKSVCSILYFPKHGRLVSGSYDQTIRVWDLRTGSCLGILDSTNSHIHGFVRHIVKFSEKEFLSCSEDRKLNKISVLDGFTNCLIHESRNEILRLVKLSSNEVAFLDYCGQSRRYKSSSVVSRSSNLVFLKLSGESGNETGQVTKVFRGLAIDRRTKLVKSITFENSFYFNCMDPRNPIRLLDYDLKVITKVFVGHEDECPFSINITNNSKNEEILIAGAGCNIYLYNASRPSRFEKNPNLYLSYYRKIELKFNRKMDIIYSTLLIGSYLLVGNSDGEISLFSKILSQKPKLLVDKVKIHEQAIFDMCCIHFTEEVPKNTVFVTSSIDMTIKLHQVLPYLFSSASSNNNNHEKLSDVEKPANDMNTWENVNTQLESDLFQVVVEDKAMFFPLEKVEVEFQNNDKNFAYAQVFDWRFFPSKKIYISHSRERRVFSSFHYVEKANEEEGEGEGDDITPKRLGKFVEVSRLTMPDIIGFAEWDEDSFLGVASGTAKISSFSIYDLSLLKDVIQKVEFLDYARNLHTKRIGDIIRKINSDLFLFLSDLQHKRRVLNIYSYTKSCCLKQVRFGYFSLTSFYERSYCASKTHSSSCFYTVSGSKGVEMFNFDSGEVVSEYHPETEHETWNGYIYNKNLMITVFLNQIREENIICMSYGTLYFLDPCFNSKKAIEKEDRQMKCLRIVKINDSNDIALSLIAHLGIFFNQLLFIAGETSGLYLDIHDPNPVIYLNPVNGAYSCRYFPFYQDDDDGGRVERIEKSARLIQIVQQRGEVLLSSGFSTHCFKWNFKGYLEEDYDNGYYLDQKDAKERASFLIREVLEKDEGKEMDGFVIRLLNFEMNVGKSYLC